MEHFLPSAEHIVVALFSFLGTVAARSDMRKSWMARIRKLERKAFGRADDDPAEPVPPLALK